MTRLADRATARHHPSYVTVIRFVLAAVLLVTGVGKLLDLRGFGEIIANYRALPDALVLPAGTALTLAELGLAAWLLSGRWLSAAGLLAAAMHLGYFGWSAIALARGLNISNCGCFGVFLARPLTPLTLLEDGLLFLVAASLFLGARRTEHVAPRRG